MADLPVARAMSALALAVPELTAGRQRAVVPPAVLSGWDLPGPDLEALSRWGVPDDEDSYLVADPQEQASPALRVGGRDLYRLGTFRDDVIGCLPGTGAVRAAVSAPPEPDWYVNASVAAFLETAWRWVHVNAVIIEIEEEGDEMEVYDVLDGFRAFAVRLDPGVESTYSVWRFLVDEWAGS
jgi:hypothetical protein